MSPAPQPDTIVRLRAANPASADEDLARSLHARAALERILNDPATESSSRPPDRVARRLRRARTRGPALVLTVVLAGGGAALAATDPLGWWSPNPGEALYGVNPAGDVQTPTLPQIGCRAGKSGEFHCIAARSGQRYRRIDVIRPPSSLSRAKLSGYIARQVAAGKMGRAEAAKFRADLAVVPDSFFRKYQLASRFGTYGGGGVLGNGGTRVPPTGVPEFLACEKARAGLSCQDLNGDQAAPVGAGVYMADPAANWRPAPPNRRHAMLPRGITFSAAEYRLLIDLIKGGGD